MLNESNIPLEEDGIEEEILVDEEVAITKAMWGDVGGNIENQTDLQNALDAKQDSLTEAQLSAVNSGITSEKVTTYDGYADQIASKADQSALNAETIARGQADTALGTRIDNEALARQSADNGLQTQIDAITSKSDVVDVVANYAALQAYDTSTLSDKDVVKVLDDETHEDALTYYRWSTTTHTWSYIGQEAPYYSKGQMDTKLAEKQDKLTAGNGLNLNGTEFSADTDVLATKEDLEGYYTKPEADNLLVPKLEAEVVAELPATGAEGKLYLTPKAHTTQTATGNPITITITDEAGKIESFQLDGDTFQQSYEGKNLCSPVTEGFFINNTANRVGKTDNDYGVAIPVKNNTSYTISSISEQIRYRVALCDTLPTSTATVSAYSGINADNTQRTITINSSTHSYLVVNALELSDIQVEEGSATAYEPYVGGQPSPNPSYPQQIQTVTGTQTISINGTDYPIDLGDIQLCGLGDDGAGGFLYEDYIYPDGEDWKVHKATATITLDGTEAWVYASQYNYARCPNYTFANIPLGGTSVGLQLSNYFGVITDWGTFRDSTGRNAFFPLLDEGYKISIRNTGCSSVENYKSWFAANKPSFYYPLATPTDTVITDTDLIAQLDAIRTASLENGTNTITNTATGSNLAGDMAIGYYEYDPTNRYDKWLWLDINNEYEQIGS